MLVSPPAPPLCRARHSAARRLDAPSHAAAAAASAAPTAAAAAAAAGTAAPSRTAVSPGHVRLVGLISAAGQTTWASAWDLSVATTPHAAAAAATALPARRVCAHSHTAAAGSADGRYVCMGSGEGCVTLIDGASLRAVGGAQGLHSLPVTAVVALAAADGRPGVVCLSVSADKRALLSRLEPAWQLCGLSGATVLAALVALLALLCALWLAMRP